MSAAGWTATSAAGCGIGELVRSMTSCVASGLDWMFAAGWTATSAAGCGIGEPVRSMTSFVASGLDWMSMMLQDSSSSEMMTGSSAVSTIRASICQLALLAMLILVGAANLLDLKRASMPQAVGSKRFLRNLQ